MARIRWTPLAERHLQAARDYVALDKPEAADHMIDLIRDAVEILQTHPMAGRVGRVPGTRELVVPGTPYIVAYSLQAGMVRILAILHSSRKWPMDFLG